MSKKICKEEDNKKAVKSSKDAEYRCKSCGAEAAREKLPCKPKMI